MFIQGLKLEFGMLFPPNELRSLEKKAYDFIEPDILTATTYLFSQNNDFYWKSTRNYRS